MFGNKIQRLFDWKLNYEKNLGETFLIIAHFWPHFVLKARVVKCDQIGLFSKLFGHIFSFESSQIVDEFLGYFGHFCSKNCCGYFWATFVNKI